MPSPYLNVPPFLVSVLLDVSSNPVSLAQTLQGKLSRTSLAETAPGLYDSTQIYNLLLLTLLVQLLTGKSNAQTI
jgi:hypothetical protein